MKVRGRRRYVEKHYKPSRLRKCAVLRKALINRARSHLDLPDDLENQAEYHADFTSQIVAVKHSGKVSIFPMASLLSWEGRYSDAA